MIALHALTMAPHPLVQWIPHQPECTVALGPRPSNVLVDGVLESPKVEHHPNTELSRGDPSLLWSTTFVRGAWHDMVLFGLLSVHRNKL